MGQHAVAPESRDEIHERGGGAGTEPRELAKSGSGEHSFERTGEELGALEPVGGGEGL